MRDAERPSGLIERGHAAKEKKPRPMGRADVGAYVMHMPNADIMDTPKTTGSAAHLAYQHAARHAKDGVTDAMRRRVRRLARKVTLLMASVGDVPRLPEPHDLGAARRADAEGPRLPAAPVQAGALRQPTRPDRKHHGRERGRNRGFER